MENPAVRKALLVCGILSSVLYVAMNVVVAAQWAEYSSVSQTVSELSAVGAPTRPLWVALSVVYTMLVAAFGWGVWKSASGNRSLRVIGVLFLVQAVLDLTWPTMHQREVLAAGGGTLTDTLHLVWAAATVAIMMLAIGFGARAFGALFLIYSIETMVILVLCGALTGVEAPQIAANLPTPWVGVWERVNIGVFLLWVVMLATALLRRRDAEVLSPRTGERAATRSLGQSHADPAR
jgi:hypothetical protein